VEQQRKAVFGNISRIVGLVRFIGLPLLPKKKTPVGALARIFGVGTDKADELDNVPERSQSDTLVVEPRQPKNRELLPQKEEEVQSGH
jgi:hypothetical protein